MSKREYDASRGRAEVVTVRLAPDLKAGLVRRAEAEGMPLAELVRRLIETGLSR